MTGEIHDLAGAYALDALDDIERARFEGHLKQCATCRGDVDDFRATAASLAAVSARQPPPGMRANVLQAIKEVRQERPSPRVATGGSAGRRFVSGAPTRWLAAAAIAIIVAVAAIAVLGVQFSSVRNERNRAQAMAQVLTAPDAVTVDLAGAGGSGRMVWSPAAERSVLLLDGLADVPAGHILQLWYVVGDKPLPAGTYAADGHRVISTAGTMPPGITSIGVTVEPTGGSATPTLPMLVSGSV
ncbi:MAG: anti-sigma factor [Ilumatobacteraceae bacterium]